MIYQLKTQHSVTGVMKIDKSSEELLNMLRDKSLYINELSSIKSETRRAEWLAVRVLTEHLFAGVIGSVEMPYIIYNIDGSPALKDNRLNISISHTKGFAAVIIGSNPRQGIDIEFISDRAWRLRERFSETHDYSCNEEENCKLLATIFWCAKETAFKALHQNEVDFIKHLHIIPFLFNETKKEGVFMLEETKTAYNHIFSINYKITDEYILTWTE
ncbi:MAG: 4'-phosphopantetheinyl transferase superfamily protein [Tannerella sp.]|jgi:phosphopantetheinyl transferase|nr:4'-phosphopantetheinyl transferase superfamily protein [Tannerella sp.]